MSAVAVRRGSISTTFILRPLLLGGGDALIEHRMAPGEIGADEHDEVGEFQILVAAGHRVGAEGALVPGDRGGHAQARIGVDIGRADEALHQLVGDVVVLGEQLARDVEGDRVWAVRADRLVELAGDEVERRVPIRPCARARRGYSSRSSRSIVSASAAPFEHRRPKLAGWSGSPRTVTSPVAATSASTPHPTPQ